MKLAGASHRYLLEQPDYQNGHAAVAFTIGSDVISYSKITMQIESDVTSINFPDGSLALLEYNFSRDDMANSKALSKILIKNYKNDIIKQLRLNYSYFYSINNTTPIYLNDSDNDYNKRLRLDGVDEVSVDESLIKPTSFLYNDIRLNIRGTNKIDYWGYNVNPNRNNVGYVPKIEMNIQEWVINPRYGIYLSGADRRPDAEYVKAALLEKIIYPTKGSTSFEYECNRVLSDKDYYEDKLESNNLEWFQNSFNQANAIQLPSRIKTGVEFIFKAEEFDPRPVPDPNEPQTCFSDFQDQVVTRFEIKSTDNTFLTTVEAPYANFLGPGYKKVIDLPLGKSYTVKFIYNASATCAFMYPFKATAIGSYYVTPYEKLAGGVRIKKIVSEDDYGKGVVKEYDYNNDAGYSSAVLNSIPNFGYYRTTQDRTISSGWPIFTRHINRNSNPTYSLNYHNGAPLIYTRVREKELDGSLTERYYDPFSFIAGGYEGQYPYVPGQDFPNLSGLLTKQVVRDKDGNIKQEELIEYEKNLVHLTAAETRNLKTGTIATATGYNAKYYVVDNYQLYTSLAEEISRTTKSYEDGNIVTQILSSSYHPEKHYLSEIETTNSKGEIRAKHFYYPFDFTGTEMLTLIQYNILKPVVSQSTYIPGSPDEDLVSKKTNYSLWNSGNIPLPLNEERSLLGNQFETELTYNAYDDKGNLQQFTARDGVVTSFIWGYQQQYPVARIIGKSYSEAVSQSGLDLDIVNDPDNDNELRTELNKLRALSGCFVTTFTYKPLVGVTSETGPDNKPTYYEYDTFNRLQLIKDQDGNVIKKLMYHYKGQ